MESSGHVPSDATQTTIGSAPPSLTFGPYGLLQRIGEGGMGEVWLAEQTRPVHRRVALKIIKAGMDSAQVVARFEAERQALALMDHPAIAAVFDAGSTPTGRPYFAMEYVKGESITTYCDRHRLDTRQRLELFIRACEGVQHAHQKGVIHRDLKPSNVLVALQDDKPVPKIIDFGIAKATTQHLTERTLFTEFGVLVGTPEYMSPEQAELTGLDVDTRTDVYALGVLLYELLTGTLPFESKTLREKGIDEIRRVIREVEPARPSTRMRHLGHAATEAARNRHSEPGRLASQLHGDLDWITMKALEKDRTRRYDTVTGLANDLRRHLSDEPVMAGPPSAVYRARKFVRRHRAAVSASVVLVLLLLAFAVTMAVQTQRIAQERNRANEEAETARQVSSLLVSLFEASKPGVRSPDSVTARELLDAGARRIDRELAHRPLIRATLHMTMGDAYYSLGDRKESADQFEQALRLRRQIVGSQHPDTLATLSVRAAMSPDVHERERRLRDVLAMQRVVSGVKEDDRINTLIRLSSTLDSQGRYGEAEGLANEALRSLLSRQRRGALLVRAWNAIGTALLHAAQSPGAAEAFQSALEAAEATWGPAHLGSLGPRQNLATVQLLQGRYAEAEASFREILRLETPLVGAKHADLNVTLGNIGAALYFQKRYNDAETYYRQALDVAREAYGSSHPEVATCLANLGQALDAQRRFAEAKEILKEAVSIGRKTFGNDNPELAVYLIFLSASLRKSGSLREAEAAAREALTIDAKHLGVSRPVVVKMVVNSQQHERSERTGLRYGGNRHDPPFRLAEPRETLDEPRAAAGWPLNRVQSTYVPYVCATDS
jgi:eukaryotic-like serine/threonine-protein kinase